MGTKMVSATDLIRVDRVAKAAKRRRFLHRVFTGEELVYAFARKEPTKHLAGRFAAKEACMKALGTGWSQGIKWQDIEVRNAPGGRPIVLFRDKAKELLSGRDVNISIAYGGGFAVATAVIFS
ncbi:MAG: holo-ACP synthase [Deltaproteobacteria bacterium]|nr:holo-ACP synthase [Deltaproteobacteria bacterium]